MASGLGEVDPDNDPLVLEHMIGFNGDCKGSVQYHPRHPTVMVSYTGCLLVIADVTNPHEQEFLRGHNEAITCLAISPSGALIASGQTSTTRVPNSEATVIVWDFETRKPIFRLMELHDGIQFSRNSVQQLSFSPDEKFLAGADDQHNGPKMCVWHTATAQLAVMKKAQEPFAFIAWGDISSSERKTTKQANYTILAALGGKVFRYTLQFDVYTMQYVLADSIMQLPSTGLARTYNAGAFSKYFSKKHPLGASYLVAGSSAGELCVFSVEELVFRAAVPVSRGGLLSIVMTPHDLEGGEAPKAYCGCGDGTLKILSGGDLEWVCLRETHLDGMIISLKLSGDATVRTPPIHPAPPPVLSRECVAHDGVMCLPSGRRRSSLARRRATSIASTPCRSPTSTQRASPARRSHFSPRTRSRSRASRLATPPSGL